MLLQIINENLGANDFPVSSFIGNIYFQGKFGLDIDESEYNRLLNTFNNALKASGDTLITHDDLLVVFKYEILEDNLKTKNRKGESYYVSSIILESSLMSFSTKEPIGSDNKYDALVQIFWDNIASIELHEHTADKELNFFRFYEKNNSGHHDLTIDRFGTDSLIAAGRLLKMFNEIVANKNKAKINAIDEHVELQSKIEKLFNDENYVEGVEALDDFSKKYNIDDITLDDSSFYYFNKTFGLRSMGRLDEALDTIDSYINRYKEKGEIEPYTYELKGELLFKQKKYLAALNCFAISEEHYENLGYKKGVHAKKEEVYYSFKKGFLDIPYSDRKFIFIGEDIYATASSEVVVLKEKNLPTAIRFPEGHPLINQVYVCHPHNQNFYFPLRSYNETLFLERINEFSHLTQCLGAIHLDISIPKSKTTDQNKISKKSLEADLSAKIATQQDFKPTKAPYVPNDLVWYPSELKWQKLAEQINGGRIKTHKELISSLQHEIISAQELTKIKAELKLLLPKAGVKYNSKNIGNKSAFEMLECVVKVKFEDSQKLQNSTTKLEEVSEPIFDVENEKNTLKLEKYKEAVSFMLEDDGIIDASERKILNRKRKKYGITKADALAIENTVLISNYSESEKKYIEELKEILEDGIISDIERKILNRYAKKFNISAEKQNLIDSIYIV